MTDDEVTRVHTLIGNMFEATGVDLVQTWESMDEESIKSFDSYVDELNQLLNSV